jgi:hypothetical protein
MPKYAIGKAWIITSVHRDSVYYFELQFTWCLHSTAVILTRLVTAWFMQRDGKADTAIYSYVKKPVCLRWISFNCYRSILFSSSYYRAVVLSRACEGRAIAPSFVASLLQDIKIHDADSRSTTNRKGPNSIFVVCSYDLYFAWILVHLKQNLNTYSMK